MSFSNSFRNNTLGYELWCESKHELVGYRAEGCVVRNTTAVKKRNVYVWEPQAHGSDSSLGGASLCLYPPTTLTITLTLTKLG